MSFDLSAQLAKWINGAGGGTNAGDPLTQIVGVDQAAAGKGAIPVADAAAEATLGTTADATWTGTGLATIIAILKTIAGIATPSAGTASQIVTGGSAVTLITGPVRGGYIVNPPNAAAQGIAVAENAYVDPVGAPGSTDAAANGTALLLTPGQSFAVPALAAGALIRAHANTSGHKLTVVKW